MRYENTARWPSLVPFGHSRRFSHFPRLARFGYRGLMLDVCRHFFSVEFIKKYLDLMVDPDVTVAGELSVEGRRGDSDRLKLG